MCGFSNEEVTLYMMIKSGMWKLGVMPSPAVSPTVDTMCGLPAQPNTIHIQQNRKPLYLSPSKLQSVRGVRTSFTVLSSPRLALKQSIASPDTS